MEERRTIGDILLRSGRITPVDVDRALDYQKDHGGFFGEALVALRLVKREELDWSLASQFDIPYIFPDADSIDPDAAAIVSPEWALANLTLPIMKTPDTLTVVVGSPLRTRALDELEARTDRRIQLALASPERLREIIRQVYERAVVAPAEPPSSITLSQGLRLALNAASKAFGISVRGSRAWFWYDDAGATHRRDLEGTWADDLDRRVTPSPSDRLRGERQATVEVELSREGVSSRAELRYLAGDGVNREYLFRPAPDVPAVPTPFTPPPASVLSEVRLLARSGGARFLVSAEPAELGTEVLAHLPALLLEPSWRSVHVGDEGARGGGETLGVEPPSDIAGWTREVEGLRAFRFDAVTLDPSGRAGVEWAAHGMEIAPIAFVLWPREVSRELAYHAGLRWELALARTEGDRLVWALSPLKP